MKNNAVFLHSNWNKLLCNSDQSDEEKWTEWLLAEAFLAANKEQTEIHITTISSVTASRQYTMLLTTVCDFS